MTTPLLHDDQQTVTRLDALACLFEWVQAMPRKEKKHFLTQLAECSDAVQQEVIQLLGVIKNPGTTRAERKRALMTVADALFINPDETDGGYEPDLAASESDAAAGAHKPAREAENLTTQQAIFAQRLRELMEAKRISQQELADRIQSSQPAISQMLNRACRPQKKTILKLAEALNVQPQELWPDIELAELLDAVASFQQPDYVMMPEEAQALVDRSKRNTPKIRTKPLPKRPQK